MRLKQYLKDKLIYSDNPLLRGFGKILRKYYIKLVESAPVVYYITKPYMDDEKYIIKKYKKLFGIEPNLVNPENFNEKNNWRKLHDRNPLYTSMVDKIEIKSIIRERVGESYAFNLLGKWDSPEEIDFDKLPEKFVLKANHAGGVIVCRDKNKFDSKKAIKELKSILRKNYFNYSREWPYKNVKRRILCEEYMGENLTDFKNYCFNGKLGYTFVWENESRADGRKPEAYFCGAYDREWKKSGIDIDYPSKDKMIEKPENYDEMVKVCEAMSGGIMFVRVDCYIINSKVYVGEMTFFPWGGFMKFKDEKWNKLLGEMEEWSH